MVNNYKIIARLDEILLALLGSAEFVDNWWKGPNYAFGMKTPDEMFITNPKVVVDYLLKAAQE